MTYATVTKLGWALLKEQLATFAWWLDILHLVIKPIIHIEKASDCFEFNIISRSGVPGIFGHREQILLAEVKLNIHRPVTVRRLKGGWSLVSLWPIIIHLVSHHPTKDNLHLVDPSLFPAWFPMPNAGETERHCVDRWSSFARDGHWCLLPAQLGPSVRH